MTMLQGMLWTFLAMLVIFLLAKGAIFLVFGGKKKRLRRR